MKRKNGNAQICKGNYTDYQELRCKKKKGKCFPLETPPQFCYSNDGCRTMCLKLHNLAIMAIRVVEFSNGGDKL